MNDSIELRQLRAHAACVKGRALRVTNRAIKLLERGHNLDIQLRNDLYRALIKASPSGNWEFVWRTTSDR